MSEWKTCPKCHCMNLNREACVECGHDLKEVDSSHHERTFLMNEQTGCSKCKKPTEAVPWYHLDFGNARHHFCSRICLVEFIAPELSKVAVVKQWIPTPKDEERMRQ